MAPGAHKVSAGVHRAAAGAHRVSAAAAVVENFACYGLNPDFVVGTAAAAAVVVVVVAVVVVVESCVPWQEVIPWQPPGCGRWGRL